MHIKKWLFTLAGSFLLCNTLQAQNLVVGVQNFTYNPLHSIQNDQLTGFSRELFDEFAKANDYKISYQPTDIENISGELTSGQLDFAYPENPDWLAKENQANTFQFSKPIVSFTDGLLVKPDNANKPLDAIKTIGALKGFTLTGYLDEINSGKIKVITADSIDDLLQRVIDGQIDAAYVNVAVADYHLENFLQQPNALVFANNLPNVKDDYTVATAKNPQAIAQFNQFLDSHAEWVDNLKQKYEL